MKFLKELNILWVDDEQNLLDMIGFMLEDEVNKLYLASNAQEAIKLYNKHKIDIVVSDIVMAGMDGLKLAQELQKKDPFVYMIFATAHNDLEIITDAKKLGINQFLLKPLRKDSLISELKKAYMIINSSKENCFLYNVSSIKHDDLNYCDDLTKLYNRKGLIRNIEQTKPVGMILIDIKNFSKINGLYGVDVGDKILKSFSQLLLAVADDDCLVHRISSDQFVFLNHQNRSLDFCIQKVNELIETVEVSPVRVKIDDDIIDIDLSVNVGISRGVKNDKLLECANMALCYSKTYHKPYTIYSKSLGIEETYKKDINAVKVVKEAIKNDNIIPFFQPIIKENDKYYEALARIKGEDVHFTPAYFLEAIKETKYYFELTKQMIEKSFEKIYDTKSTVSLNISFEDISNSEIVNFLEIMVRRYNMKNRVIIEILESDNITDFDLVFEFVTRIKSLGIKVAIDDFGSGYSNFSQILKIDPDYIKIDGTIIKDIDKNKKHYSLVKSIVNFAKEFDIKVVAEYVETKSIYDKLKQLKVDGFQGFYLAKPSENLL